MLERHYNDEKRAAAAQSSVSTELLVCNWLCVQIRKDGRDMTLNIASVVQTSTV